MSKREKLGGRRKRCEERVVRKYKKRCLNELEISFLQRSPGLNAEHGFSAPVSGSRGPAIAYRPGLGSLSPRHVLPLSRGDPPLDPALGWRQMPCLHVTSGLFADHRVPALACEAPLLLISLPAGPAGVESFDETEATGHLYPLETQRHPFCSFQPLFSDPSFFRSPDSFWCRRSLNTVVVRRIRPYELLQ